MDFEIKSENGKYVAEIKRKLERKFELTISKIDGSLRTPIWSSDYDHDGYEQGILSLFFDF